MGHHKSCSNLSLAIGLAIFTIGTSFIQSALNIFIEKLALTKEKVYLGFAILALAGFAITIVGALTVLRSERG